MKKFKITFTLELDVPDEFEVVTEQKEQFRCLQRGHDYYFPIIEWLGRRHYMEGALFGQHETAPGVGWESVDDDTANDFISWTSNDEYDIQRVDDAT
jgi:hypothetical protein